MKSHCRGDNAHSFVCVRLFSPRKYESIFWGPLFLKITTKRHNVSAKTNTLHNASVCKQPPNANLWLGSCPLERTRLIAERASLLAKWSVFAQQPRFRANALHLTLCVRLLATSATLDFRKCKRLLLSSLAVYAQRFVASNNATHSCDKSHNRWLCPLRSISANASACFSLHLRSARYIGDPAGYCVLAGKRSMQA